MANKRMKERQPSIFSGMFSLLSLPTTDLSPSVCLNLPVIDFSTLNPAFSNENRIEPASDFGESEPKTTKTGKRSKKIRKVMTCAHPYRKYYAKGMCNNCYHKFGRVKKAWHCTHSDQKMYAKGMCQACYLQHYHFLKDPAY